ncbi:MAG: SRPBCC family protein, partial [Candidatus Competibacterales bacterium]|nr:SRPBCC family protein [Candidatus Competibacterales bacterium]
MTAMHLHRSLEVFIKVADLGSFTRAAEALDQSRTAVSRDIAAPAEEVWNLVADVTRMGEWSPEATGAKWRKDASGPTVGASFQGT